MATEQYETFERAVFQITLLVSDEYMIKMDLRYQDPCRPKLK